MKKSKFIVLILLVLFCTYYNFISVDASEKENDDFESYTPTINDDFDDDIVIITLTSEYSDVNKPIVIEDFLINNILYIEDLTDEEIQFHLANNDIIIENIEDITYINEPDRIVNRDDFCQIILIDLLNENKEVVLIAINELENLNFVEAAEPSYYYDVINDSTPDDNLFYNQWGLNDSYGIDADLAWDFTNGYLNPIIKVGIFERNIQFDHPDLRVGQGNFTPSSTDSANHGTHVAGIIGAVCNNTIGISGVAQVEIVLLDNSSNNFSSSLTWAYNNGIRIVNASFAYVNKNTGLPAPANVSHETVIKNFSNNGGILVTSAGNEGLNSYGDTDVTPQFPACYGDARLYPDINNVLSVGALNSDGNRRPTSNYGTNSVHIYAPGGEILSTFPESNWGTNVDGYTQVSRGYAKTSGTLMAAPHVTGVLALLLSIDQNLTVSDLRNIILNSAETGNISLPSGTTQSVKKLNAFNAVKYVLDNYAQNSYNLTSSILSIENTIYPGSSYFYNKNIFIKLNVNTSGNYNFVAHAINNSIDVKLYDSNFTEVSISKTYMDSNRRITFTKSLSTGEYYVRVSSSNSEPQIVDLDIQPPHSHSYTTYSTYSSTKHKAICSCGSYVLEFHVIGSNSRCILCGANASAGIMPFALNNVTYITENGSYMLPNGVIILVEADMNSFVKNKTDIYS